MTKKFNIALISDHFHNTGGIETHIKYLYKSLTNLGNSVIIITTNFNDKKYKNYKIYNIKRKILINGISVPYFTKTGFVLYKIFKKHKINIIHCHQSISTLGIESIFFGNILNIKTCYTEHSIFSEKTFLHVCLSLINKFIIGRSQILTSVSYESANNFSKRITIDKLDIKIIPNGIDPKYFNKKNLIYRNDEICYKICESYFNDSKRLKIKKFLVQIK